MQAVRLLLNDVQGGFNIEYSGGNFKHKNYVPDTFFLFSILSSILAFLLSFFFSYFLHTLTQYS